MARLAKVDLLGAHLASLVPLEEAIRMVVGDALVGRTEPSVATSGFWMWDRWMRARLKPEIEALHDTIEDQRAYGLAARAFIDALYQALQGRGEGPVRREISNRAGGGPDEGDLEHGTSATDEESFEPGPEAITADEDAPSIWPPLEVARLARHLPYRAYTTRHDQVARAEDLVPQEVMRQAQETLDKRRSANRRTMARL